MARKLVVEIIGDASSLNRSLKEATVASNRFGKDVSHSLRGVASGTGIMHNFGRSLAFASGGFLAFEGVSHFLTDSVKAAVDAGVAQRSLTAQMRTSGESFAASREQIEKANLGLAKFGFTSEDAEHALTVLERGTGNIQRALSLETLSADLARAKNIDLASAANVVAKVFGGQETALRRAVPGLSKQAHGLDLIRAAQERLAGQARAGTTEAARFAATLHDTEVIVGTQLLPTLNKYLTSISTWLDRTNRSGELQRDVAGAVKVLTAAVDAAKSAVDLTVGAFRVLNTVTGSTKETLKLLFSAFIAFKTVKLAATFADLSGSIRGVGTAAEVSTGKVRGLRGSLGSLPALVATTVAIDIVMSAHTTQHGVHRYSGSGGWANLWHDLGHPLRLIQNLAGGGGGGGPTGGNLFSPGYKLPSFGLPVPAPIVPHDLPTVQAALPIVGRGGLTPMQRAQLALSAAGRTKTMKDDLAALVTQRQLLGKAITTETARLNQATSPQQARKFADNLQKLQDQDAAAFNQILSITKKGAQQAKRTSAELAAQRNTWFDTSIGRMLDRVQDIPAVQGQISRLRQIAGLITQRIAATKDITRKLTLEDQLAGVIRTIQGDRSQIQQAAKDAQQAALDTQKGWLDFAVERAQATKTVRDDRRAYLAVEAFLKNRIRHEGRTLELVSELWRTRQSIRDLNKKNADVDPLAGLRQVSSKQLATMLAAGTGLGAAGQRTLAMNIAGAEIQPTHIHVHLDGREVATVVSKQQARTSRRTAKQTSGFRG